MWRLQPKLPISLAIFTLGVGGCGQLGVQSFQGSYIALALNWPAPLPAQTGTMGGWQLVLPPGAHLDLWAAFAGGRVVRVPADEAQTAADFPGFDVRTALNPNDPCLIDGQGHSLLSLLAQAGPDAASQVLQQQAVVEHVRDVVDTTTPILPVDDDDDGQGPVFGKVPTTSPGPLLALVRFDQTGATDIANLQGLSLLPKDAASRLGFCNSFLSNRPDYYQGSPLQLTAPVHGKLYGFFNFDTIGPTFQTQDPATFLPPQDYGGITIISNLSLDGVTGLLLTLETAPNPTTPGMTLVQGVAVPAADAGRGVIGFALEVQVSNGMGGKMPMTIGTASVLTDLDQELD